MRNLDGSGWRRFATAFALLAAAACGSSQASNPDGGEVIDCATDPRVTKYKPSMTVTSASGALVFELVQSNPGPPARGTDTWTIRVTDAAKQALPNLALSVLPFMPDHGHGTSVNAQVTANGDGSYTVAPLYLFMPGVWRITFTRTNPNDTAVFYFCIPG